MPANKAPRRLPKYRHHKTTNRAVVRVHGRDVYLGPFRSPESLERYARIVADMATGTRPDLATPRSPAPAALTVSGLVDAFLDHAERYYAEGVEIENYRPVLRLLVELNGSTPVAQFTPRDLRRFRARLVADGRVRTAINRLVVRVRTVFRWGVGESIVPVEVATALSMVRGLRPGEDDVAESGPVRPVDRSLVEATIEHAPPGVAAMIRLQLLTGARPGEVCAIRPGDVDTSGPVWWYTPASHKNAHRGKVRRIPLVAAAQEILRPFLLRPDGSPCFSPAEAEAWYLERRHAERRTPLSCGNRPGSNRVKSPDRRPGSRYSTMTYAAAIRFACRRAFPVPAGITAAEADAWRREHRWGPNRLRHLVATEVRQRFGLEAARIVCGHATASTTERYYAEVNASQAAEYLAKLA